MADLKEIGLPVAQERELCQYLGIKVQWHQDSYVLTQEPLIERLCNVIILPETQTRTLKQLPAKSEEALDADQLEIHFLSCRIIALQLKFFYLLPLICGP